MSRDISEILFESVDLIVNARLNDLQYDKTELCTIEEVKGNGEYYVSNGSAKYFAYSENTEYRQGTSVYVTIPQGNYNNQKIIVGKYTSNDKSSIEWVSPLEDFVNITGNIVKNNTNFGLIPNDEITSVLIWESDDSYTQYDRLCITGDFTSDILSESLVIEGDYGLMLVAEKADGSEFIAQLSAADMTGNPYDFEVPYTQQKMFMLDKNEVLNNLKLYFYQMKNFKDIENKHIPVVNTNQLLVENISVNFGYAFDNYSKDTVLLFTNDILTYAPPMENDNSIIEKELQCCWIHKTDTGTIAITDIKNEKIDGDYVKVHWYRYNTDMTPSYQPVHTSVLAGDFWEELIPQDVFSQTVQLNREWKNEIFKVIIEYNDKLYISEPLTFTNSLGENNVVSLIKGIKIDYPSNDPYKGKFFVYGSETLTGQNNDAFKQRKLIVSYDVVSSLYDVFEGGEKITWKIPLKNTMIVTPKEGIEYDEDDEYAVSSDGNYALISRLAIKSKEQIYRISDIFDEDLTNSIIYCIVERPGIPIPYETNIEFLFGIQGANGTNYTFNVYLGEEIAKSGTYYRPRAITVGDTQSVELKAQLYDMDNKPIEGLSYKWEVITNVNSMIELDNNILNITDSFDMNIQNYVWLKVSTTYDSITFSSYLPLAKRTNREYQRLSGPSRILYDANGGHPEYNKNAYKLFDIDGNEISNIEWQTFPTTAIGEYPKLKQQNGEYILLPSTLYFKEYSQDFSVGNQEYWVQPIYIDINRYGNALLNEWDESLVVDPNNNLILTSMVGAGSKNAANQFSGVVMGELKKLENTDGSVEENQTGLLGFDDGVQSFGFNVDGSAFLGAPGKGRISFNGEYGYLMSGNFNGFGSEGTTPTFEKGVEPDFNFNDSTPKGVYIGLSSGNAYFAGTLYTIEGKIGGWTIGDTSLYSKSDDGLYTILKSDGNVGLALGVPASSWEENNTTSYGQIQLYHNGKIRLGNDGNGIGDNNYAVVINGTSATFKGTIYATGGEIGGCSINNGKLEIPVANISGKLTADNIDATNLKVKAANITGTLTANQINGNGLSVSNANISNLTITGTTGIKMGNSILGVINNHAYISNAGLGIAGDLSVGGNLILDYFDIAGSGTGVKQIILTPQDLEKLLALI